MSIEPKEVEFAVLLAVVELHPRHLTAPELIRKMSGSRDEDEQLGDAIRELKAAGLFREEAGVLEPTLAALRAATILVL